MSHSQHNHERIDVRAARERVYATRLRRLRREPLRSLYAPGALPATVRLADLPAGTRAGTIDAAHPVLILQQDEIAALPREMARALLLAPLRGALRHLDDRIGGRRRRRRSEPGSRSASKQRWRAEVLAQLDEC